MIISFRVFRPDGWITACSIVILLFNPWVSHASKISLDLTVEVIRQDHVSFGHVLITNRGDEAAHDLQAILEVMGDERRSPVCKILNVGESWETKLPILEHPPSNPVPGRYPIVLRALYADANGHPFSALAVNFFEIQEDSSAQLSAEVHVSPVSDHGALVLEMKNLEQTPVEVSVHWVLPGELVADRLTEKILVNAKDSVKVKRRVRNLSALPGSQYPVFAVIEYDKEGKHFSAKAMAALPIIEPVSFVRSMRVPLFVVLGILLLAVILLQFRHTGMRNNMN